MVGTTRPCWARAWARAPAVVAVPLVLVVIALLLEVRGSDGGGGRLGHGGPAQGGSPGHGTEGQHREDDGGRRPHQPGVLPGRVVDLRTRPGEVHDHRGAVDHGPALTGSPHRPRLNSPAGTGSAPRPPRRPRSNTGP